MTTGGSTGGETQDTRLSEQRGTFEVIKKLRTDSYNKELLSKKYKRLSEKLLQFTGGLKRGDRNNTSPPVVQKCKDNFRELNDLISGLSSGQYSDDKISEALRTIDALEATVKGCNAPNYKIRRLQTFQFKSEKDYLRYMVTNADLSYGEICSSSYINKSLMPLDDFLETKARAQKSDSKAKILAQMLKGEYSRQVLNETKSLLSEEYAREALVIAGFSFYAIKTLADDMTLEDFLDIKVKYHTDLGFSINMSDQQKEKRKYAYMVEELRKEAFTTANAQVGAKQTVDRSQEKPQKKTIDELLGSGYTYEAISQSGYFEQPEIDTIVQKKHLDDDSRTENKFFTSEDKKIFDKLEKLSASERKKLNKSIFPWSKKRHLENINHILSVCDSENLKEAKGLLDVLRLEENAMDEKNLGLPSGMCLKSHHARELAKKNEASVKSAERQSDAVRDSGYGTVEESKTQSHQSRPEEH